MTDYEKLAAELGRLVQQKQEAYGDSFGKSEQIFKVLYPNGVKPEQYSDFLTLVRIVDKMFRIATKKNAFGENPFMDIEGYALLARSRDSKVPEQLCGNSTSCSSSHPHGYSYIK